MILVTMEVSLPVIIERHTHPEGVILEGSRATSFFVLRRRAIHSQSGIAAGYQKKRHERRAHTFLLPRAYHALLGRDRVLEQQACSG